MNWFQQCIRDSAGVVDLSSHCRWGLSAYQLMTLLIGLGLLGAVVRYFFRKLLGALLLKLRARQGWPLFSNLANQPAPSFVGRKKELRTLARLLVKGRKAVVHGVVHASGGVGKTSLALEAARQNAARFEGVWVIPAATPETARGALAQLAAQLNCPEAATGNDEDAARAAVAEVARRRARWLFIYDNANTPDMIARYMPGSSAKALSVLVTSRATNWPGMTAMNLGQLAPGEAASLLLKRLPEGRLTRAEAEAIAERLGFLALALVAAAGYLRQQADVSAEEYIAAFDLSKSALTQLDWNEGPGPGYFDPDDPATHSIPAALNLSIVSDALDDEDREMLCLLGWMYPDDLAPDLIAENAGDKTDWKGEPALPPLFGRLAVDPGRVMTLFHRLAGLSLIEAETPDGADAPRWHMHRLTGEYLRLAPPAHGDWGRAAARLINAAAPYGAGDMANRALYARLLPMARHLMEGGVTSGPAARLLNQIAHFCLTRGVRPGDMGFAIGAEAAHARTEEGSAGHAAALNNLAAFQEERGALDEALTTYSRVREIEAALPGIGTAHPSYAATLNNIAGVHRAKGEFAVAEGLLLSALEIDETALPPGHPSIVAGLANLGALYSEWAEATTGAEAAAHREKEDAYNSRALAATRESHGPGSEAMALAQNNEAARLFTRGDRPGAEAAMRRAAAVRLDRLGAGHGGSVSSLRGLLQLRGSEGPGVIDALIREAADAREEQQAWGRETLSRLFARYGVDPSGEEADQALARAVAQKQAGMKADGAPVQAHAWLMQEVREAVFAATEPAEIRADFQAQVIEAIKTLQARGEGGA